ncbi:hypothetical protein A2576_01470 [Candidatus Amesbacteria bacterium RIFOXYD1_FULL_47_9]|uniref:Aspartate racemase n=3 Tax=Candidatus Amesiibacteriota TaxID=1752730 RepID=A0A1F4Z8R8_9BACT|nr:MAG: Aspartate racemase [Candidatus Amesbacteria bacterium GW2011_GWA2_47_11]OGD01755.1 MAG: hypothetical protein A2354_02640 [Candidatus Amesbacteria bacterium RIFOXYB1_FULL_47_12]OGD02276.1 MAG: hypothetical protein A3E17_00310 [Candidatus Amesbacteria bacterium RIFCSPHIGHO2_12_FULL_48_14]OGD12278.1 MAG: hypothetical protein A2576_01470 [Candidatus Amesbacteria bacterium RIFOXYD1_FULL_47_9]
MKTLGVIGGLGPQTTADLYRRIGELVDVSKTGQRPHIIIDSIPITTYLENENIIHEREFEPVLPYLINAAINLEKSGADFIVLACNSLHIFTKEITEAINVPFVSITDTVVQTVLEKGYKKVGLLGTIRTNSSKMYDIPLKKQGVDLYKLDVERQKELNKTIIRLINNTYDQSDSIIFHDAVYKLFDNGVEGVILACTDLHLLMNVTDNFEIIDAMEVLAQRSAKIIQNG